MRTVICFITILASLLSLVSEVPAASSEQAYQKARKAYYALQDSSRKQMYRDQWLKVIDKFAGVHKRYPETRRGADSLYMWAKTTDGLYAISRIKDDALKAVELYEKVALLYPGNSLADDSLLRAGELLEGPIAKPEEAYLVYQRLVTKHSKGDMASKAKKRLAALKDYAPRKPKVKVASKPTPTAKTDKASPAVSGGDAKGNTLTAIRYWSNPGYTRIVLDLGKTSEFSAHFLAANKQKKIPPRLYVDIAADRIAQTLKEPTLVNDGLLQRIRTGQPDTGTVRVVLDLESVGDYKVFPLNDPYRVVIDIAGEKVPELKRRDPEIKALPGSDSDAIAKVLSGQPKDEAPLHVPTAQTSTTLRRIVVDAGHGGKDPGAVGPGGTYEKTVTLDLAKRLAKALRKKLDCEVILTRSGDVYLPLEERTAIANKLGADLFISVHANANKNRKAYGVETYYLNFSKNDKAAAVAARENGTTLKQVSDLEMILFDLMANAKINESSRLAAEIQENLVSRLSKNYSNIRNLGVRQGPFYVLLGATMPSVLVETAFISNPREEKRLKSGKYQDRTAEAIAVAVKNYAIANKLIASR